MSMLARYSKADINVIGLVGERSREVQEFIEDDLGPEGDNGARQSFRFVDVQHHRNGDLLGDRLRLGFRAGGPGYFVSGLDEHRPHDRADIAVGSGQQYSHAPLDMFREGGPREGLPPVRRRPLPAIPLAGRTISQPLRPA